MKNPAQLSETVSRRLNGYVLAAAAAGVTVLSCAAPAEGAPVCKKLSADISGVGTFPLNLAEPAPAPFNVAQTTLSFFVSETGQTGRSFFWWNRGFFTPNSGGAKVLLGANDLPADVAPGAEIGPGGNFGKGASYGLLFTYGRGSYSQAQGGGTKRKHRGNLNLTDISYVGFEFNESGQLHYGWARLAVTFSHRNKHTVLHIAGYGYESTPGTAIAAGSCGTEESENSAHPSSSPDSAVGSLGMLALGSAGFRH